MKTAETKTCTKCELTKPLTEFSPNKRGKYKKCSVCKKCQNAYRRQWRKTKTGREYFKKCNQLLSTKLQQKRYYQSHPYKGRDWQRRNKKKAFDHYGGCCARCKITDYDVLTIDHINNDGRAHRKELQRKHTTIYRWLIKNSFPPGYQVLCRNCNWKRHIKQINSDK